MKYSILLRAAFVLGLVSPPPVLSLLDDSNMIVFFTSARGQSTTFYVAANGNDDNDGLSEASPWQTLQHVESSSFSPGDAILFRSGDTFRGSIEFTGVNNIYLGTYPQGQPPATFKGSILVPNNLWSLIEGIYVADLNDIPGIQAAPNFISQVYEDEHQLRIARYPNWDEVNPENSFLHNDPLGIGTTIVDSELPGGAGYWDGAWVVIRSANYQYQMTEVESNPVAGTLILSNDYNGDGLNNLAGNDWGYFLVNKLEELDAAGEWYYDSSSGLLYALSRTSGIAPQDIEVVINMDGLFMNNSDNFVVENIRFAHYADAAIEPSAQVAQNQSLTINECVFSDVLIGIRDLYSPLGLRGRSINNCTFERCLLYGVRGTWFDGELKNCTFNDVGLHAGFNGLLNPQATSNEVRGNEYGSYSAIYVQGDDIEIFNNVIKKVGNNGINISGNGASVTNNFVTEALSLLNDGAAITFDNCDGCIISLNIVSNSIGVLYGQSELAGNNEEKTTGIYFGNGNIANTIVSSNVVSNCSDGILIDHAPGFEGNGVFGNTVYGCHEAQIVLQDLGIHENPDPTQNDPYFPFFDTEVKQNILYCLNSTQFCLLESQAKALSYSGPQPLVTYGLYDENKYYNPFSNVLAGQQVYYSDGLNGALGGKKIIPWTLNGWRARYQQDALTSTSPLSIRDFRILEYLQNPLSNLSSDCEAANSASDWYDGCGPVERVFDGGSFANRINNCAFAERSCCFQDVTNTIPGFYSFSFKMRSENADVVQQTPIYNEILKYDKVLRFGVSSNFEEYEFVGDATAMVSGDYLLTTFQDLQFVFGARANSSITIDDIVVQRVVVDPTYEAEIQGSHLLRYNCPIAPTSAQNVGASFSPGLAGQCWSDVYGNFYDGADVITLDEWASIVLFRYDGLPTSTLPFVNDVYTVVTDEEPEIWTADQNIQGRVVVSSGSTLIIDGATIGFAPSTSTIVTNLVVEPGGVLELRNGAMLTSWQGCSGPEGLWDGVKVLGTNGGPGAGQLLMNSGAQIRHAKIGMLAAAGPSGPEFYQQTGGIIVAENAAFVDNQVGVMLRPIKQRISTPGHILSTDFSRASFTDCVFSTRQAITPTSSPKTLVSLYDSQAASFAGCTFRDSDPGPAATPGAKDVRGIVASNTAMRVFGSGPSQKVPCRFEDLYEGIRHRSVGADRTFTVVGNSFTNCERGINSTGTMGQQVSHNEFRVSGEHRAVPGAFAYGVSLYGATGFELEQNTFLGSNDDQDQAQVGLVLTQCGPAMNEFYNNRFDGFKGGSDVGSSTGTIIRGVNNDPEDVTGLQIKCNDYSTEEGARNEFDIAFTVSTSQPQVAVASKQGANLDAQSPAGNTFAAINGSCLADPAQHLYEELPADLNLITYWHHQQPLSSTVQLKPECENVSVTLEEAGPFYNKQGACPVEVSSGIPVADLLTDATNANAEFDVLKEVYDNWKDAGNTTGLIAFINDLSNSSYAVRNQLMLAAPKVSKEAWSKVFARPVPLNSWHLAQALLANSPLQPEVLEMFLRHPVEAFYKELVEDGQLGGVSMHSIYESELAHFKAAVAQGVHNAATKVLVGDEPGKKDLVHATLDQLGTANGSKLKLALYLSDSNLTAARNLVDLRIAVAPADGYWKVQDLWVEQLEQGQDIHSVNAATMSTLQGIANNGAEGAPQAHAWLAMIGSEYEEDTELPKANKRLLTDRPRERSVSTRPTMLNAYPNPTNGPVYLTYTIVEGVESAQVELHNAQGQLVRAISLGGASGIAEIQAEQLTPGIHIATLYFDGVAVGSTKVNVVR